MTAYKGNPLPPATNTSTGLALGDGASIDADFAHQFRLEVEHELVRHLLPFWIEHVVDHQGGGFFGQVSADRAPVPDTPKTGLLNARILWTFSRAYRRYGSPDYLAMAQRARCYLMGSLWDTRNGGLFWSVDHAGILLESHKHIYLQAFGIYGLAEFAHSTGDAEALRRAIELYRLVERHASDRKHGGYRESFECDWSLREDGRLNPRFDPNEPKTMNTHLHLLEAYTGLLRVWPDAALAVKLAGLLRIFIDRIVDPRLGHCKQYFGEDWEPRSDLISFGHDIEASWLLVAAVRELGDSALFAEILPIAIALARAVLAHGTDNDGGVFCEAGPAGVTVDNKDWWQQAEAVVGFLDAFELSGDIIFLQAAHRTWQFIQHRLIDHAAGEWRWRASSGDSDKFPLVSKWKCPYHNGRMCIEVAMRLEHLASNRASQLTGVNN